MVKIRWISFSKRFGTNMQPLQVKNRVTSILHILYLEKCRKDQRSKWKEGNHKSTRKIPGRILL